VQAIVYAYTHKYPNLAAAKVVPDEFQERSLLGLMREFTLTFMQWWGDACAQSQPILHSAVMAFLCHCSARLLAFWRFLVLFIFTTRITFVADVALLLY
jgi:hypothetical protein